MSSLHSHPTNERLARVLAVRDLTDPNQGPHVMQQLVRELHDALAALWQCRRQLYPSPVLLTQNEGAPAIGDRTTPVAGDYLLRPTTGAVLPAMLTGRSEEHTSELQSRGHLVCRLLLVTKNLVAGVLHLKNPFDQVVDIA